MANEKTKTEGKTSWQITVVNTRITSGIFSVMLYVANDTLYMFFPLLDIAFFRAY